ncbi:hypothetical protein [Kaarinaea lacus]
MAKTSAKYKLFSASSAFFVWGGWSYFVNSNVSSVTGIISGITQGIASFVITLIVVFSVTKIYNAFSSVSMKIVMPAIITVSCICVILVLIHSAVRTPHILYTIAPSLTVAFLFCIFTATNLSKNDAQVQN